MLVFQKQTSSPNSNDLATSLNKTFGTSGNFDKKEKSAHRLFLTAHFLHHAAHFQHHAAHFWHHATLFRHHAAYFWHIFCTMLHIFGTMRHIFGTLPHIFGTMPHTCIFFIISLFLPLVAEMENIMEKLCIAWSQNCIWTFKYSLKKLIKIII